MTTSRRLHHPLRRAPGRLAVGLVAGIMASTIAGCGDGGDGGMVMQPTPSQPGPPDSHHDDPTTRPSDARSMEPESAFVTVISEDGELTRHEFPPAMLWLRPSDDDAGVVLARLYTDDPEEATARDWAGEHFFFEMKLALPPRQASELRERIATGGELSPDDVAGATWYYRANETETTPSRNYISFPDGRGGHTELRPEEVRVDLEPMRSPGYVDVLLLGDFAEPSKDDAAKADPSRVKAVRVRAVMAAKTVGD